MTLSDIKRKTDDAHNMDCIYIANKNNYRHCVSDKCFYWNDLDTHVVKTNVMFRETMVVYPTSQDKVSIYEISNGVLQYTTYDKFNDTKEVKAIEDQQKFFETLKLRTKVETSNIYFDEEEQLFYTKQERKDRIGYCMKVAKELDLL